MASAVDASRRCACSQRSSASGESWICAALCSSSPRCSRLVSRRSPSGRHQEARARALVAEELAEHDADTQLRPRLAIRGETLDPRQQPGLVGGQRDDGGRITPDHLGGQRGAHQRDPRRLVDRHQHALDFLGIDRCEDALLQQLDAADVERRELAERPSCAWLRTRIAMSLGRKGTPPISMRPAFDSFSRRGYFGRGLDGLLADGAAVNERGRQHPYVQVGADRQSIGRSVARGVVAVPVRPVVQRLALSLPPVRTPDTRGPPA